MTLQPDDGTSRHDTTPEHPVYTKIQHAEPSATKLFMIICDEGWRSSIVCERMYGWAADWLLSVLGRQPFAPDHRPWARLPVTRAVARMRDLPDDGTSRHDTTAEVHEQHEGGWRASVPLPFYGFLHVRCQCGERFRNWRGGKRRSWGTPEQVYQWHYRREHIPREDIRDVAGRDGALFVESGATCTTACPRHGSRHLHRWVEDGETRDRILAGRDAGGEQDA